MTSTNLSTNAQHGKRPRLGPGEECRRAIAELQRLEAIAHDPDLTIAERMVLTNLVLHVNRATWQTFPGVRLLQKETRCRQSTIDAALIKAEGRHVRKVRLGGHGVQIFEVIPWAENLASASPMEALKTGSASQDEGQNAASASAVPSQRFPNCGSATKRIEPEKAGREPAPAPESRLTGNGNGKGKPPADLDALAERTAYEALGGRCPLSEVRGSIEADVAAKVYSLAALGAWLDSGGRADWPRNLKAVVAAHAAVAVAHAAASKALALAELIRRIHDDGRTRATHVGSGRTAAVVDADAEAARIVLEERVGGDPGRTAEELEAAIADVRPSFKGSGYERVLLERLAAVQAGRPDPAARPPERRRLDIRTAEALAEWCFTAPTPAAVPVGVSP